MSTLKRSTRPFDARWRRAAAAWSLGLATLAQADTVTLQTVSRGVYNDRGMMIGAGAGTAGGAFLTGTYLPADYGRELRSFFVFDLSAVSGRISAATLAFEQVKGNGDAPLTFAVSDFSGDIAALSAGRGGVSAFDDLGGGVNYGSQVADEPSVYDLPLEVVLNAEALAGLGAAHGTFALGGALTPLPYTAPGFTGSWLFGGTSGEGRYVQLVLEVEPAEGIPEPHSLTLVLAALAGLCVARRRGRANSPEAQAAFHPSRRSVQPN